MINMAICDSDINFIERFSNPVEKNQTNNYKSLDQYSDIIYIEKSMYYVYHTVKGNYIQGTSLTKIYNELKAYYFVRPHAGYIVNSDYITSVNAQTSMLLNGKTIPISQKNLKTIKNKLIKQN